MLRNRSVTIILTPVLLSAGIARGATNNTKLQANPTRYASFAKPLSKSEQFQHALNRLAFGARTGDLEALKRIGIRKWVDAQLSPDKVPENATLANLLRPLESLDMSIHEAYIRYPSPQMIAAVARGRDPLPDDPELRAVVVRLADRYLKKQNAGSASEPLLQKASVPTSSALLSSSEDLESKVKLSDILSTDQIDMLHSGTPDQKRQLLASLPADKRLDFVWALRPEERRQLFAVAPVLLRRELMLSVNPQNVIASDLTEAKLLRAIYSNRQLKELLVDFWYNHFNVFIGKGGDRYMVPSYERDAIRPHVLGKFHDLLLATAESPAMLFYLDNWQSVAPQGSDHGTGARNLKARRGLNENYGRELLELHTLGVDGGYTQKDVIEVARCFTGWTIAKPNNGGGFEYNDKVHDKGEKVVLGHRILPGGGFDDGLTVLDILARHPSTAHFISVQLARRFIADDPPPSLVNRMAETFRKTDGDLRAVTRTMLTSREFWSEGAYQAKVKTPFEMVASAVRATGADVDSAFSLAGELQRLGEPAYRKPEPTGYSSANAEWVSSAGLLERMNFALALTHNRLPGVHVNTARWENLAETSPLDLARSVLHENPSDSTARAIRNALSDPQLQKQLVAKANPGPPQLPSLVVGLSIGSPEFQKH